MAAKQKLFFTIGQLFPDTNLVYLGEEPSTVRRRIKVQCACGKVFSTFLNTIRRGDSTSCGCIHRQKLAIRNQVSASANGASKHWAYCRWLMIRNRCENVYSDDYKYYGAKGIQLCGSWHNFWKFAEWLASQNMTADSIFDVHRQKAYLNYSPSNCICLHPSEHHKIEAELRRKNSV